jgi:hypothetical protein
MCCTVPVISLAPAYEYGVLYGVLYGGVSSKNPYCTYKSLACSCVAHATLFSRQVSETVLRFIRVLQDPTILSDQIGVSRQILSRKVFVHSSLHCRMYTDVLLANYNCWSGFELSIFHVLSKCPVLFPVAFSCIRGM